MYKLLISFYYICLLLATLPALAGDPQYPASTIPAALKEKAHAVKRMEEITFTMTSSNESLYTRHYVITILDGNGEDNAHLLVPYDKLREIRAIHGVLYDADGKSVKKLKQGYLEDIGLTDGFSIATDDRAKKYAFYHSTFPYTVEFEVTMRYNNTYIFPDWVPQGQRDLAVEQSRISVSVPANYKLRYRAFHYQGEPRIATEKENRIYTWEAKGMKARTDEVFAPGWNTCTTAVWLAPSDFEMEAYKGNMNSWEEYGKFMYQLNKDRDQLPEAAKQTVHQLTDGVSDPRQKIKILYRYLQEHTRYISIQLGIGGWQTFDATAVAAKGYGDCKALSNYMCAMLKEAGITGYCTLVKSGNGRTDMEQDFPSNQFNHVIACVPMGKDTTWLECTSQLLPAGYLGSFTANRPVLIITEKGGKLVHTPVYGGDENRQLRHINASITPEGNVLVQAHTVMTGEQQDDMQGRLHVWSKDQLKQWIGSSLDLPSYDMQHYEWKELGTAIPGINEDLTLTARNYAAISGKRMFIEPNLLNKSSMRINSESQRESEIRRTFSFVDVDSVQITIPAGYRTETLPKITLLHTRFGTYSSRATVQDSIVTYVRTMSCEAGVYPATAFAELQQFYDNVYKADRAKLVFVKNE
ncbi:DUF3857 domain-containing protein [Chitinophaga agrisoli]|uniref:DUF3857 domain-containing protein n=1 Tax=Chitinophaga agrisoli TaxID=2607653 RepID=A0A5B2VTN2_9BACT|nr:DUF3857 and transglutaminase domain-containing protein [Chitinophaga agrisoli]KAA2243133.1 DUF3857 domain-containing protein [Chitinophaga agrisoli]